MLFVEIKEGLCTFIAKQFMDSKSIVCGIKKQAAGMDEAVGIVPGSRTENAKTGRSCPELGPVSS